MRMVVRENLTRQKKIFMYFIKIRFVFSEGFPLYNGTSGLKLINK